MKYLVILLLNLALVPSAWGADDEKPAAPPAATEEGQRDPFSRMAVAVVKPDYDQAGAACLLLGVVRAGGRERALFRVGGAAENSSEVIQVLARGEKLRVVVERVEYLFTVSRIRERGVELRGDNNELYNVSL